ncbi:MAG: DinB family protein [Pseudomonadota bacterium]
MRDGRFVSAQVIRDVVEFLSLDEDTGPQLSPAALAARYGVIIDKAVRLVAQMPDEHLTRELPNRPRSWRVLLHHVFQIPKAYLDMEATGETLTYEGLVAPPPDELRTSADIAAFGRDVAERFDEWWQDVQAQSFDGEVPTYFGGTSRHEMLERTVWHSTQHVRQVASLLEQVGITPEAPLTKDDLAGLPLTERVWDEN